MNNLSLRILFQNDACIVINKLKGEAVEGAKDSIINLPQELKNILNYDAEAVNRLDVPVTGCALFALEKSSLAFLNSVFKGENSCSVEKRYWAIIEKPKHDVPESGELAHWIETNSRQNKSFAFDEEGAGRKRASLRYKITGEGTNYLFMEIKLFSGRHHQIRAQLAAAGLHIKGDLKYGAKRSEKGGGIRLHARYLSFPNPLNKKEKINVTAEPPEMDNLWESFIKYYF